MEHIQNVCYNDDNNNAILNEDDVDSDREDCFEDEDEANDVSPSEVEFENILNIQENIKNIRKIVCFFRKSTVRNHILQDKIKLGRGEGHSLELKLDVKTRWNSLIDMVERFINVREYITESLLELNNMDMLAEVNFNLLCDLVNALKPIKLAVESLSRQDASLSSADAIIEFMMNKLRNADSEISKTLLENLTRRIAERTNKNLMNLLKSLNDSSHVPSKHVLDLANEIMQRIFSNNFNETENNSEIVSVEKKEMTMEEELEKVIQNSVSRESQIRGNQFHIKNIKQEFTLFRNTGKRTENLEKLFDAICSIKPTSTDSERVFSISANFCTKIRSRLSDKSLNALVFLKSFYLKLNKDL